jgi:predicted  nucleic acid-binding Zn-ribbon protein
LFWLGRPDSEVEPPTENGQDEKQQDTDPDAVSDIEDEKEVDRASIEDGIKSTEDQIKNKIRALEKINKKIERLGKRTDTVVIDYCIKNQRKIDTLNDEIDLCERRILALKKTLRSLPPLKKKTYY